MPKNALTPSNFDYTLVDKDTQGKLIYFANEINQSAAAQVAAGLDLGKHLKEARELLDNQKQFKAWVDSECCISTSTAYNHIKAFEEFGECDSASNIELSAMYKLANHTKA